MDSRNNNTEQVGVPFEVRIESDVVYVFDFKHRHAILKTPLGALGVGTFNDSPETLVDLEAKHELKVFVIEKGIPVRGLVVPGHVDPNQIEVGDWKTHQPARLSVPSGKLRVETATSSSLMGEQPDDDPGVISLPPGEYEISLHERLDVDDSDAPLFLVIGIVPADASTPTLSLSDIRFRTVKPTHSGPAVVPPPRKWVSPGDVKDSAFNALAHSWQPNSSFDLNVDRKLLSDLGLGWGTRLEVEARGVTYQVAYVGDGIWANQIDVYRQLLGNERSMTPLVSEPEAAIMQFFLQPGWPQEIMRCVRIKGDSTFKCMKGWIKVKVRIRPDVLTAFDRRSFDQWKANPGILHGEVLARTNSWMTTNWDRHALQAAGIDFNGVANLQCGGVDLPVMLFDGDATSLLREISRKSKTSSPKPLHALHATRHWYEKERQILIVVPLRGRLELNIPAQPGDAITLLKGKD